MNLVQRAASALNISQSEVFKRACHGQKTRDGWVVNHRTLYHRYTTRGGIPKMVQKYCKRAINEAKQLEFDFE